MVRQVSRIDSRVKRENDARSDVSQKISRKNPAKNPQNYFTDNEKLQIRELFESVYVANRWRIFGTNFLRGVAFGLGTFIGGTIVVALVVWILTRTVDLFPWARDFTERLINSIQK